MTWTRKTTIITTSLVGVVILLVISLPLIKKQLIRAQQARQQSRVANWRSHVWPEEKRIETERIKSRQQVNETVNATTINLRPFINARLTDAPSCWKGNNDNNFSELPAGEHIYAGVPFDVAGSIQLMGGWMKHYHKTYPAKVENIPINRSCAHFHLLQGNSFLAYTNFGNVVARLVIHYVDGSSRPVDLVAGKQSFDFWNPLFKTGLPADWFQPAPGTERAWTGSNPYLRKWQPDFSLVLYKTTLANPQPEIRVASVDFVSTETITCPFLVGLTVD